MRLSPSGAFVAVVVAWHCVVVANGAVAQTIKKPTSQTRLLRLETALLAPPIKQLAVPESLDVFDQRVARHRYQSAIRSPPEHGVSRIEIS